MTECVAALNISLSLVSISVAVLCDCQHKENNDRRLRLLLYCRAQVTQFRYFSVYVAQIILRSVPGLTHTWKQIRYDLGLCICICFLKGPI